jgi:hypothetical protein
VHVANQVLCHPSGSLPEQTTEIADWKAAYRLFSCKEATVEAIAGPHWEQTRRRPPGTYLVLSDTTELDFGVQRKIAGMSKTGNGGGWGFLLHSALVVAAEGEEVIGLAGQKIRYRMAKPWVAYSRRAQASRCRSGRRSSSARGNDSPNGKTRTAPRTAAEDRITVEVGTYAAKYRDGSEIVRKAATGCRSCRKCLPRQRKQPADKRCQRVARGVAEGI